MRLQFCQTTVCRDESEMKTSSAIVFSSFVNIQEGSKSEMEALNVAEAPTIEKHMKGGCGVVWKGLYKVKSIAIKQYRTDKCKQVEEGEKLKSEIEKKVAEEKVKRTLQGMARRFRHGASLLKWCDHPNLIRVIGYCEEGTNRRLAMEWLPYCFKEEIRKIQDQITPRVVTSVANVIRQILLGLNYLHSRGIVHGDIKPHNICLTQPMYDEDTVAKIVDFDHSYSNISPTKFFAFGTGLYNAPERQYKRGASERKRLGPEIDMWSLGIILMAILCSFPGFDMLYYLSEAKQKSKIEITQNDIDEFFKREVQFLLAEWPEEFADLMFKLLKVDPSERLTCDEALRHELFDVHCPPTELTDEEKNFELTAFVNIFDHKNEVNMKSALLDAASLYICNTMMDTDRFNKLAKLFLKLDRECKGVLDVDDIQAWLESLFPDADQECFYRTTAESIIQRCNLDVSDKQNPTISFSEFVSFATSPNEKFTDKNIEAAFERLRNKAPSDDGENIDSSQFIKFCHTENPSISNIVNKVVDGRKRSGITMGGLRKLCQSQIESFSNTKHEN